MRALALALSLLLLTPGALAGCGAAAAPTAEFTASPHLGKVPISVQFTDESQGEIDSWAWDFDNDGVVDSTDQNPRHTFSLPGTYTITLSVTGPGGTSSETKASYLRYNAPVPQLTAVSPSFGLPGDTLFVTANGTDLQSTTDVSFGEGIQVGSISTGNGTQIRCSITIAETAAGGPRDIWVTTAAGMIPLAAGFTVAVAPDLATVEPNSGNLARTLDVIITGSGFSMATNVGFGDNVTVESYTVEGPSRLIARISIASDASTGARDITITTPGGTGILPGGFTVTTPPPPLVTALSPHVGGRGESIAVSISGTDLAGTSAVTFRAGVDVSSFNVESPTLVTAHIRIAESALIGPRNVSVTTPGGTATLNASFNVIGINPTFASRGEALPVVITGVDFSGVSGLSFGDGISVTSFAVDSPTQITAQISVSPTAVPGVRDITVRFPDDTESIAGSFRVAAPECTADFVANRTTGSGVTTVQFTDKSTGDVTAWAWDLNGDGKTDSTAQNPSYKYAKNGTYTVTLTVSGEYCQDSETKTGYICIKGCST